MLFCDVARKKFSGGGATNKKLKLILRRAQHLFQNFGRGGVDSPTRPLLDYILILLISRIMPPIIGQNAIVFTFDYVKSQIGYS